MSVDPYKTGLITGNIFREKRDVTGKLVCLVDLILDSRGLKLISPKSRALLKHEIHELILTDEQDAGPDSTVNRISTLGFFEVDNGGIVVVGDKIAVDGRVIGEIAGFDVTHMPNHINIVLKSNKLYRTVELNLSLNQAVTMSPQ
jgi:hypothetical protein